MCEDRYWEWQRLLDVYSDQEVATMSKKTQGPPKADKEDVIHHIMDDLRQKFPIDAGDENPGYISDPQTKKTRKAKRDAMLNRTSDILKKLDQNGIYPRPDATGEGQIFKEIIGRLVRGQCPCKNPNCPARQPSIKDSGCSCGGKCGENCGGSCGSSSGSSSSDGGCSSGGCGNCGGHKKP